MEIPGYTIQREIGTGGMATVYLAIQESLNRPVVLKILDQLETQKIEDMAERFIAEGRIIASLNHPHIITIHDIGLANHLLYLSMEYVQGGDLKERMELPVSVDETLDYMAKIASALGEAHKHDVVHRDVKPANILFREDKTPLLSDFGIAKQVNLDSDLTSTGIFLGSPNYVSPEQADGGTVDGRTDIYSLGCIFYEMLTSSKPYQSNSVIDIVIQHKQAPIPTLPEDYADLQPLLNRMMAKNLQDRFPNTDALIDAITQLQKKRRRRGLATDFDDTSESLQEREALRERRSKWILAALLLLGLVLFSTLKYVEVRLKSPPVQSDEVSTDSVLNRPSAAMATETQSRTTSNGESSGDRPPLSNESRSAEGQTNQEEVVKALTWLGNQSLEEYKLTYPAKDNAYYYFNRLLEVDPGSRTAIEGIQSIADRYAILAEQTMTKNQWQKTAAYVDIGLKIDPDHASLLAMQELVEKQQDTSLMAAIKNLFTSDKEK